MSESIKNWALMMMYISAGAFLVFCLLPSGSISKTAKSVIAVLCMASVTLPMFKVLKNEKTVLPDFDSACTTDSDYLFSYYENGARETVRATVEGVVRQYTQIAYECDVYTDITADGCINIKRILITFEKTPDAVNDIAVQLENALGIVPEFEVKRE